MALLVVVQNKDVFEEIDNKKDKIIVTIIFLIGAPVFVCSNILEELLNLIVPEDDDERKL